MKKYMLAFMAIAIFATTIIQGANAQDQQNAVAQNHGLNLKLIRPEKVIASEMSALVSKASFHALKQFSKAYPTAANAQWYQIDEGGFVAHFQLKETDVRAFFDKNGQWRYSIHYLDEEQLPQNILVTVKTSYYGYDIASVQQLEIQNQLIYLIKVEDTKAQVVKFLRYTYEDSLQEIE